jgi:hypothetical protein
MKRKAKNIEKILAKILTIISICLTAILAVVGIFEIVEMINGPHTSEKSDEYDKYGHLIGEKPIIYLYPEKEMDIKVKLGYSNKIVTSYPKYDGEWDVRAYPDGKLIDNKTNRELYGLYWEGEINNTQVKEEGFIVEGKDTISFLEEKLEVLGLNEREANEFIIYWLPRLESNKYNYIRFESIEEINNYMPLIIDPEPESIIRVLMYYKPLNDSIKVKEQELVTPKRTGYTVVEWGGSLIK